MIDLSVYTVGTYTPGRPRLVQALWFFIGLPLLRSALFPLSGPRVWLLRAFGATIGKGVNIKPGVRVKYPWLFVVGDYCWIGEDAWIDNLVPVRLGNNVVLSQGVYLCTGNHDWSSKLFELRPAGIEIEDGCWVGARSTVLPGVNLGRLAIAAAGSVVTRSIPANEIHAGNPAAFVKRRVLDDSSKKSS